MSLLFSVRFEELLLLVAWIPVLLNSVRGSRRRRRSMEYMAWNTIYAPSTNAMGGLGDVVCRRW